MPCYRYDWQYNILLVSLYFSSVNRKYLKIDENGDIAFCNKSVDIWKETGNMIETRSQLLFQNSTPADLCS